ncbi:hypothetical protein EA26_02920 [Vibrio navarrensis]|uniref:Uncharacterized protein n=1 Tax=Vibrio navarrensis TaxID=29495 RepID=A0A099LRN5_9VIBR|nr:hypothetical protein EA26_02920 [Vibrio navarrensis]KGK17153.1 hypothetical protein EA25_14610 [Vibrio navarrensis]MBE4615074.1 hypothetical protein [Vibrio navarrensis]
MEKVNNWLKHSVFIASRLRNAVKKKKKREPISIPVFPEQQNKGLLTYALFFIPHLQLNTQT